MAWSGSHRIRHNVGFGTDGGGAYFEQEEIVLICANGLCMVGNVGNLSIVKSVTSVFSMSLWVRSPLAAPIKNPYKQRPRWRAFYFCANFVLGTLAGRVNLYY